MKTLSVYIQDSYYRYANIYVDFLFVNEEGGDLSIYKRDSSTGSEQIYTRFKNWDYLVIEDE